MSEDIFVFQDRNDGKRYNVQGIEYGDFNIMDHEYEGDTDKEYVAYDITSPSMREANCINIVNRLNQQDDEITYWKHKTSQALHILSKHISSATFEKLLQEIKEDGYD